MTTLDGIYSLTGIMEMAAGFKFTPAGRFEFFYVYGASDRNAIGKKSGYICLNNRQF